MSKQLDANYLAWVSFNNALIAYAVPLFSAAFQIQSHGGAIFKISVCVDWLPIRQHFLGSGLGTGIDAPGPLAVPLSGIFLIGCICVAMGA